MRIAGADRSALNDWATPGYPQREVDIVIETSVITELQQSQTALWNRKQKLSAPGTRSVSSGINPTGTKRLTIVVPLYNEQQVFEELCKRLDQTMTLLKEYSPQILFVSDGSTDNTDVLLEKQIQKDSRYSAILLARNFGHQSAVTTGIEHATGELIGVIDGDLQDPPEVFRDLIDAIEDGADVAYAVRKKRKEGLLKRTAYSAFYRILQRVSEVDIPLDSGDFCCMKRSVADAMIRLPERRRFVRGLRAWVGFKQVGVEYERHARFAGESHYSLSKLMSLAFDGLFSFTSIPVKLMQCLGFVISFVSLTTAVFYLGWFLIDRTAFPTGFATLAISIWFVAGIQLLFMGIVGEYVVRSYEETRGRPSAVVARLITHIASTGGE